MTELSGFLFSLSTLCLWLMSLTMTFTNQRPHGIARLFDVGAVVLFGVALVLRIVGGAA